MMRSVILLAIGAGLALAQDDGPGVRVVAARAQIEALKRDLATAQQTLDDLKKRYSDAYPDVKTAREQLMRVEAKLLVAQRTLDMALVDRDLAPVSPKTPAGDATKLVLPDLWWRNPATVQYLGLTPQQALKMDDVVAQYRQKLVENNYELEKQQKNLARMVGMTGAVNENDIGAQIDRVADARAQLEKTNGRMLLGIRELLTPEQWTKLNQSFTMNLVQK